ncbi:trypsin-like peptidase domain-containing protein [Streptomyces sp. NPDC086549]|uniref:VMAP-C domain-containing protein n=1 Tax=Streptomyces sp. NPDC086549 TaxID=3365752 RepID=UPI003813AB3A
MSGAAWHARIECGRMQGAGFLVTPSKLLTCAHVVQDSPLDPVTVTFPNSRELCGLPATVVVHGGWQDGTDPGDLVVLDLDREVPLAPARFAPPGAELGVPAPDLFAYGFPEHYDEGMLARYRALPPALIADEWVQLEAVTAHGQPLAPGFSGAAVTLRDGRVVGMVTQIASEPNVLVGRMLPTVVMARYWQGLGELVPVHGGAPGATRRLYGLVRRAEAAGLDCDPNRLYVDAVGPLGPPLPPEGFSSLRPTVEYVQWEVPDPEAVTRLADRLEQLLDTSPARAATPLSPIVVEIEHSGAGGDEVTVEVSAYRDGQRRRVGAGRLPRTGVRSYVQERLDEAFAQLAPDADELIAFVLPRRWFDEPVAEWECGADDSTPLGCAYPVVVTNRDRHRGGRKRHELAKKWRRLDASLGAAPYRVECGTRERPSSLRKRLRDEDTELAGFASPAVAAGEHFDAGLNLPVPALLWSRTGCSGGAHDDPCDGSAFLDELTASVAGVPPAELPRHVRTLREAAEAADEPDRHWARNVQLLWDDPRCFPLPSASLHSPVA